jgi:signal transduction histidine kinase
VLFAQLSSPSDVAPSWPLPIKAARFSATTVRNAVIWQLLQAQLRHFIQDRTQLDLAALLQTLIDDYHDLATDITFRGPPSLVNFGRPLGLKRVITNLVDNAIHYGIAPEIELQHTQNEVVIRVLDRGPGIAAEYREGVCLPFYRLESSRNKSTGGVGLGLSTARAIVLEHGGTLTLAERQGGGLEAVVVLPV